MRAYERSCESCVYVCTCVCTRLPVHICKVETFQATAGFYDSDISESNNKKKSGVDMHFECDFSTFRIETLCKTLHHKPVTCDLSKSISHFSSVQPCRRNQNARKDSLPLAAGQRAISLAEEEKRLAEKFATASRKPKVFPWGKVSLAVIQEKIGST